MTSKQASNQQRSFVAFLENLNFCTRLDKSVEIGIQTMKYRDVEKDRFYFDMHFFADFIFKIHTLAIFY